MTLFLIRLGKIRPIRVGSDRVPVGRVEIAIPTDNLCAEASKSLTIAEGRNKELALKLATADRDRRSAKAGLMNAEA